MPLPVKLIADSGSTKTTWCILGLTGRRTLHTEGISPYFLGPEQIQSLLQEQLLPALLDEVVSDIYYYGTGLANPLNADRLKQQFTSLFPQATVEVHHDLMGAARSLCGHHPGIACILGTGSNSCEYDGGQIVRNSPGLGYVLGDEGSGAYLGKKVLQYYLYDTFDQELKKAFESKYSHTPSAILDRVYRQPLANRYLASFTHFLSEHRGHVMIENILEDGFNDFFFTHIRRYDGYRSLPIHFTGSVAFIFRDVLADLAKTYDCTIGKVVSDPMEGLVNYHASPANAIGA